jgi:H+/Na+-translocating ferredoxin:NAD+ oxidoreductase subunit B
MTSVIILLAAGTMLALALFMAYVLGWANRAFHVEVDPRQEAVLAALPGANCGGCGYVGCNEYAEAVVAGEAPVDKCPVGGESCAEEVAKILGVELDQSWPVRPVVHCRATLDDRLGRNEYRGEQTCAAANLVSGVQGCTYGCMGLGDCSKACDFDAIHVVDGVAVVDYDKCVGCGACERVCPRHIISMVPFKSEQMLVIQCSNQDFGKDVKAVCKVGCIGCKACSRVNELFEMSNNLPHINYDDYDPEQTDALQVVVDKCPMKGLIYAGKPSARDLAATADKEVPDLVRADFHTTVDDTDYRAN